MKPENLLVRKAKPSDADEIYSLIFEEDADEASTEDYQFAVDTINNPTSLVAEIDNEIVAFCETMPRSGDRDERTMDAMITAKEGYEHVKDAMIPYMEWNALCRFFNTLSFAIENDADLKLLRDNGYDTGGIVSVAETHQLNASNMPKATKKLTNTF